MSIYTQCVSRLLFPLHERMKGHSTVSVMREMETTQWWPKPRIDSLQLQRLSQFMCDIDAHVPYYRELFKRLGIRPEQINSLAALQGLPFTTKQDFKQNRDAFKADNAQSLSRSSTGGSSGEPLIFYIGNDRVSHDVAAKWRATRWWGVDIGDPEVVLWGSPIELNSQDRVRLIRDKLFRSHLVSAFEMNEQNLTHYVDEIVSVRPDMIFGYPSALSHMSAFAAERGIALDELGVKVIFVTSEKLYDHQRERIESAFACPVANGYGGRDAGFIAHQCPHGSMHITAEDMIIEIVDAQGQAVPVGESGEIVVTHLFTKDFPFVRYRTGDMGALSDEPCSCGRGLPVLKEIQGRSSDFFTASDGTVMHGAALNYIMRELDGIEQYKLIQESIGLTRVQIVKNDHYLPSNEDKIRGYLKQRLGEAVDIVVEYLDIIKPEKSGKYRYVVSKVDHHQLNESTGR